MADSKTLNVVNYFDNPVDVVVTDQSWNCCDSPQRGYVVGNIPSKAKKSFVYCRTDGHGCNGRQGEFQLSIESTYFVDLNFDANADIQLSSEPTSFAAYISQASDGNYNLIVAEAG